MRLGLYRPRRFFVSRRCKKIHKVRFLFFMLLLCTAIIIGVFYQNVRPVFLLRMEHYMEETAGKMINRAVEQVFSENSISYQNLVDIRQNENGEIVFMQADAAQLNILKSQIHTALLNTLKEDANGYMDIPFGSILKQEVFAAAGPNIKIKVNLSGAAQLDFGDKFEAVGINQTRHTIYLDVTLTLSAISATMHQTKTIHNQIPVAQTVIVGDIPQVYLHTVK